MNLYKNLFALTFALLLAACGGSAPGTPQPSVDNADTAQAAADAAAAAADADADADDAADATTTQDQDQDQD